jgi:hypothetical protein
MFSCIEDVVTYLLYTNQHQSLKENNNKNKIHNSTIVIAK